MIDWKPLKDELANPSYSSMTSAQKADAINAKVVPQPRSPYYINYRTVLGVTGDAAAVEQLASYMSTNLPTVHAILSQVGDNSGTRGGLDNSATATQTFLDGLPALANRITAEHVTSLKALGTSTVSWTLANLGLPYVTDNDIEAALK